MNMNMKKRMAPKIMYEDDLADKLKVVLQELGDVMKATVHVQTKALRSCWLRVKAALA